MEYRIVFLRFFRIRQRDAEYPGKVYPVLFHDQSHFRVGYVCPPDAYAFLAEQSVQGKSGYDVFGPEESVGSVGDRILVGDGDVFYDQGIERFQVYLVEFQIPVQAFFQFRRHLVRNESLYPRQLDSQNRCENCSCHCDKCEPDYFEYLFYYGVCHLSQSTKIIILSNKCRNFAGLENQLNYGRYNFRHRVVMR